MMRLVILHRQQADYATHPSSGYHCIHGLVPAYLSTVNLPPKLVSFLVYEVLK